MIRAWVVTVFPVAFLTVLFGGGSFLRRKNIDMDGVPPINRAAYASSKYLILVVWAAMVAQAWGVDLAVVSPPGVLIALSVAFWIIGFSLLLTGRLCMGDSFRIGSPRERTCLKIQGLFRISRNPMYLGVYTTLLATVLYTLNPLVLLAVVYIIAVHHRIVLAEEEFLRGVFGEEYAGYCGRVRRYL